MTLRRRQFLAGSGAALAGLSLPTAARLSLSPTAPRSGAGKKLLVLGGTGFLGPHVVTAALARGMEVTLFNRGRTNADLFPELETLLGDRHPDRGEGLKALEGTRRWDYVVDTSSYLPRITRAAATLLADRIERYALISTISVYAGFAQAQQDETAAVGRLEDPTQERLDNQTYGPLKALCEEAAEEILPGRVANLRPGLIVGPRDNTDRFTYWPVRLREGGDVIAPGRVDDPVQYIDVRDLAEFTVHCLEQGHVGVMNANGPIYGMSIAGLVYGCRAAAQSEARIHWIDAPELEELGLQPWGDLPVWTPSTGEMAGMGTISVRKAIAAGLKSRSLADTVRDTLEWWDERPEEERQLRSGMSREKEAEALGRWRASRGDAGGG
jgi:2'-hydroxyisoflavone reductase